jgi:hypothetical protein
LTRRVAGSSVVVTGTDQDINGDDEMTAADVRTLDELSTFIHQLEADEAVSYPTDQYPEELS